jgi:pullulanase/glycogen debranching enzyme
MTMATSRPAVLFDIDGTLVDSNYLHVHAWQRAFTEVGLPVEAWRIHRSIGMDGSALVDELSDHAADDGESNNKSWNCGAESPTDDPEINALRARQQRNLIATTVLSQGTPMISHGDELGRNQGGNNNGYCQDNEITWIDWAHADAALLEFTSTVSALRAAHPIEFTLPPAEVGKAWDIVVDTAAGPGETAESATVKASGPVRVESRAMVVLQAQA